MAILKAAEVRSMAREDRMLRLHELRTQLMNERGIAAMGGSPPSPGKIRQLRTAIARIHTINRLEELDRMKFTKKEVATGAAAEHARRASAAPKPTPKKAPARKPAAPKKKTATAKKPSGGKTGGNE